MFNAMDQIRSAGIIHTVSINFCAAPEFDQTDIFFFVVASTSNTNTFQIIAQYELRKTTKKIERRTAIQTFYLGEIPVDKGQYLAVRFAPESGRPHTTQRNLHYASFEEKLDTLEFQKCSTSGIAMYFEVQSQKGKHNPLL